MNYLHKYLILLSFFAFFGTNITAHAESKSLKLDIPSRMDWSDSHKAHRESKQYNPYLENSRHLQIPQWAHQDWAIEDWTSQTDGMTLIKGWYAADILRDQNVGHAALPVLVVGPNFYHLSGLDKRRVATTVDVVYDITKSKDNGAFTLTDWYTKKSIGVFDRHGLRLH